MSEDSMAMKGYEAFQSKKPDDTGVMDWVLDYHLTQALGCMVEELNQQVHAVTWHDDELGPNMPLRIIEAHFTRKPIETRNAPADVPLITVDTIMAMVRMLGHWVKPSPNHSERERAFVVYDEWDNPLYPDYLPHQPAGLPVLDDMLLSEQDVFDVAMRVALDVGGVQWVSNQQHGAIENPITDFFYASEELASGVRVGEAWGLKVHTQGRFLGESKKRLYDLLYKDVKLWRVQLDAAQE